ncbi:MAG: hypothetical protein R6U95_07240, partial [Bacteroidales bacterium]
MRITMYLEFSRRNYIKKTIQNNGSRNILTIQIESDLHSRQGMAVNNFELTLPQAQSDLAIETIK